jgi:hypothetical protein
VKATRRWTVTFEGTLDDAARDALNAAPELETVNSDGKRHRIVATGATGDVAIGRVREALGGGQGLSGFQAAPVDE